MTAVLEAGVVLAVHVMQVDSRIDSREKEAIKEWVLEAAAMAQIPFSDRQLAEVLAARPNEAMVESAARTIRTQADLELRDDVMQLLLDVIGADERVRREERDAFVRIAKGVGWGEERALRALGLDVRSKVKARRSRRIDFDIPRWLVPALGIVLFTLANVGLAVALVVLVVLPDGGDEEQGAEIPERFTQPEVVDELPTRAAELANEQRVIEERASEMGGGVVRCPIAPETYRIVSLIPDETPDTTWFGEMVSGELAVGVPAGSGTGYLDTLGQGQEQFVVYRVRWSGVEAGGSGTCTAEPVPVARVDVYEVQGWNSLDPMTIEGCRWTLYAGVTDVEQLPALIYTPANCQLRAIVEPELGGRFVGPWKTISVQRGKATRVALEVSKRR